MQRRTAVACEDNELGGDPTVVEQVVSSQSADPHALLGAHMVGSDVVIRCFRPTAKQVILIGAGQRVVMQCTHPAGIYACRLSNACLPLRYELEVTDASGATRCYADAYAFSPTLGELDLHLAAEGTHARLFAKLGAHPRCIDGVDGVSFAVWAPNAKRVSTVGGFNQWDGRVHQMRQLDRSGIWEIFIPEAAVGDLYRFELKLPGGQLRIKTDPVALQMELRPDNASVVCGLGDYTWGDAEWMAQRERIDWRSSPMAIYEVHLGSWMRAPDRGNAWLSYRELAPRLIDHCSEHGYTHVELLPIAEHAFDPSWGYQTTGYFAPTARYGGPDDLRFLIDACHRAGIGVILDWVPAHFPKDDYALRRFDGTALYEHSDPREGEHRDWGTLIFNYGRNEVRSFLLSNAVYWLDEFHFDGLRVDAVASMIYRDYSRKEGEWVPNRYGGRENLEAIAFLKQLNREVGKRAGVVTIAEESTAWPGVTRPVHLGGLGFHFKWNMGWMHDTLNYFSKQPIHRKHHHGELTFSMLYAYSESYVLPLSHDEVVHGKGSLLRKMPGDAWQQAANYRLLLAYMYAHPGKKLLFMGAEFAQSAEWNFDQSLDWHLAAGQPHAGIQRLTKDLGAFYRANEPLWAWDSEPTGFDWIDCHDADQSVVSFVRRSATRHLVCVFNFTPVPRENYRIGVPAPVQYREAINTDGAAYGGSNVGNGGSVTPDSSPFHGQQQSVCLTLPPLAALILMPRQGAKNDS